MLFFICPFIIDIVFTFVKVYFKNHFLFIHSFLLIILFKFFFLKLIYLFLKFHLFIFRLYYFIFPWEKLNFSILNPKFHFIFWLHIFLFLIVLFLILDKRFFLKDIWLEFVKFHKLYQQIISLHFWLLL